MNWQSELDELRRREQMAHAMGGPDKIKRQHDGGRLTVRERIAKLIDPGSFHEVGAAGDRANLMEPLLDCARAHASEGEIVESLQQVFGDYAETPVF